MRKTIIGAAAYCGCVTDDRNNLMWSYLFTASKRLVINCPSKLWFLIMAGKSKFSSGADGLGLGILLYLE